MELEDFRQLSFERKCDMITFGASYLCHRRQGDHKIFLYDAEAFFVEVLYSVSNGKVTGFNAFHQMHWLEPYLDMISLEDLSV